jgi:hypothetical protein
MKSACALLALLILSLLFFSRAFGAPFMADDWYIIPGAVDAGFSGIWQHHHGFYRPIVGVTFLIQERICGLQPLHFRILNVGIHAINTYLVFRFVLLLLRVFFPGKTPASLSNLALASSVLFLVMPSHTQPVAWISARPDLMATTFCLLSLLYFLPLLDLSGSSKTRLTISQVFFVLALFSKESSVCLPLLFIAFTAAGLRRKAKFVSPLALTGCIVSLLNLGIYLLIRKTLLGSIVGGYGETVHLKFSLLITAKSVIALFLRSFLPPLPQFLRQPLTPWIVVILGILVFVGIVASIFAIRKLVQDPNPITEFSFGFFLVLSIFICILPAANLGISMFSSDQERLTYLPSVFSCIFLAFVIIAAFENRLLRGVAFLTVTLFYATTLLRGVENYRKGGEFMRQIENTLNHSAANTPVLIVNAPDTYRGIYVCRGYIGYKRSQNPNLSIIALQTYHSSDSKVLFNDHGNNLFEVTLTNPYDRFRLIGPEDRCIGMFDSSQTRFRFEVKCSPNPKMLLFTEGKLIPVHGKQAGAHHLPGGF